MNNQCGPKHNYLKCTTPGDCCSADGQCGNSAAHCNRDSQMLYNGPLTDCIMEWSNWSNCSKTCGGGMQSRTATIIAPASGGIPCPAPADLTQLKSCNIQACPPVDCIVSDWSSWTTCTASCGGGMQTRTRDIIVHPNNGGSSCPTLIENQLCNTHQCT